MREAVSPGGWGSGIRRRAGEGCRLARYVRDPGAHVVPCVPPLSCAPPPGRHAPAIVMMMTTMSSYVRTYGYDEENPKMTVVEVTVRTVAMMTSTYADGDYVRR